MKNKLMFLIIILITMLIVTLGYSYAYLKLERFGSNNNNLVLSNLDVILLTDLNNITIDNAIPVSDSIGIANSKAIFQIKNNANEIANYRLSLTDTAIPSTIANQDIRYQLKRTKGNNESEIFEIQNLNSIGLIDEGIILVGDIYTYELVMWIDINANPNGLMFAKNILVEGMQVSNLDISGANYPELLDNMIPVYYDSNNSSWRIADSKNIESNYKWFDYNDQMWANAVTVRQKDYIKGVNSRSYAEKTDTYTVLENGDISFDGVDDFLNLGYADYNFGDKISLVARFKLNSYNSNAEAPIICNDEMSGFQLGIVNSKINFAVNINNQYSYVYDTKNVEINKWYTVVGTYDGVNLKLYVDGVLVNSISFSGQITISTEPILLSANPKLNASSVDFISNSTISDVYIYTDILNGEEISKYFKSEILNYCTDHLLTGFNNFSYIVKSGFQYTNASMGTVIPMADITSIWTWIPRFKYAFFNSNDGNNVEKLIDVKFEHGIDSTGTITCYDNISTSNSSLSSENCEDTKNSTITNEKSTYTHPAFDFGDEKLTGFWFAKFEMGVDSNSNILIKPDENSFTNQSLADLFTRVRSMELDNNIYGFKQKENVILNNDGIITGDDNKYDIHLVKNMEWGAVSILSQSKYGKFGNDLYTNTNRRVYKNNYVFKTGYSGYSETPSNSTTNTVLYNDLTNLGNGQGYKGAGASTTGNVYGIYDMSGGAEEFTMGNIVDQSGNFYAASSGFTFLNSKYYDKYSYNSSSENISSSKLGDMIKETLNWGSIASRTMPNSTSPWFLRGGNASDSSFSGIYYTSSTSANCNVSITSRPVLVISRDMPWLQ